MSNRKLAWYRNLHIIVIGIMFFLSLTTVSHVDAVIGCCEKTNRNNGAKSYMDATKEDCDAVPQTSNNTFTVKYFPDAIALNNTKCLPVPPAKTREEGQVVTLKPAVSIPGSKFIAGEEIKVEESTLTLANYIVAIFKYATGVIGIIAAIMLMAAGIMWLTAGGNHEQISTAKQMIFSSLIGMSLSFGAFLLLSMVNTNLVNLRITPVQNTKKIDIAQKGCCKKFSNNPLGAFTTENSTSTQCEKLNEQVGNEDNQYFRIEFFPFQAADENDCVPLGCCSYNGGFTQYKPTLMYKKECDEKGSGLSSTSFVIVPPEKLTDKEVGDSCP